MSSELSGVRSSCDMFARNSDLYLEVSVSCSAFSSSDLLASSTSLFLASTSSFCFTRRSALSCNSSLVLLSSSCCIFNSPASDCDCASNSSVRVLVSIVFKTIPILSVSWFSNSRWVSLNTSSEASSITAFTLFSNNTGRMIRLAGLALPSPEFILIYPCGTLLRSILSFSSAHCPTRPSPIAKDWGMFFSSLYA